MNLRFLLVIFTLAIGVSGCNLHEPPMYQNQYGTFSEPAHAACAHLFQRDAREKYGDQITDKIAECKRNAVSSGLTNQMHAQQVQQERQSALERQRIAEKEYQYTRLENQLTEECINRYKQDRAAKMPTRIDTECHSYGANTRCTSREARAASIDHMAGRNAFECRREAIRRVRELRELSGSP